MTDPNRTLEEDREWLVNQIAHALRNPIFAASVQTEALQLRARDPQAVHTTVDKLHGQLQRLSKSIDEMLLFGRSYAAHPKLVQVAELLEAVSEPFDGKGREEPAQLTIDAVDPTLEGWWDPEAVILILERFLNNAVQHTEAPHEIHLAVEKIDGNTVALSVIDRGHGIPAEILEKALLPFFPQHAGRPGLGLAVAEKFARILGGRIEILSEESDGTTARCILPLRSDG